MVDNVRFFLFEKYHNKRNIGSSRIRAHNLIKYWPGAALYKYGENPDAMIYQKVYTTLDYKFQQSFGNIQILDICDPDFKDTPDVFIKETMDAMDAVVVPTESFREFLQQMTDTPVRVIKDRFDLEEFPKRKIHQGDAKTCVWFGYAHNAMTLKGAILSLEKRGINIVCVSNEDPMPFRWASKPDEYEKKCKWIKYTHPSAYEAIQLGDIAILPKPCRPFDRFKSENKAVIAQLLGIPVAENADELDALLEADARNKAIDSVYDKLKEQYDCKLSVKEYKELIKEIEDGRKRRTS